MRVLPSLSILIVLISFPAHSQVGAVETHYAGWSGNRQVVLDEQNNSFDVTICPGDDSTQYTIIRGRAGEIAGVKPFGAKRKSSVRPVKVVFSKDERFGIPIAVAEVTGVLPGQKTTVRLERSEDVSFALAFGAWARCPRIGYFPGLILVLVTPSDGAMLDEWAKNRANLLRETKVERSDDPEAPKNLRLLAAIEGEEITALTELRKLPFVIAATMDPIPYGPPGLLVDLPKGTLPKPGDDRSSFEIRLGELFKSVFPRSKASDFKISSEKGLRYVAGIFGPTNHFVSSPEYKGTWLKTDLIFRFYRSPTETDPIERLVLEIPDGFLPRWPADAAEAPLQDHYNQFHLSPDGKGKTADFSILNALQDDLGRAFESRWRGQIID
jgi:hypothetical protein